MADYSDYTIPEIAGWGDDDDIGDDDGGEFVGSQFVGYSIDEIGAEDVEALLGARVPSRRAQRQQQRQPLQHTAHGRRGQGQGGGMTRMPSNGARQAMAMAIAQKRAMEGALVRSAAPTKSREYPLNFDSVTPIAAGVTLSIAANPQVLFRPERLVVPSTIAPAFLIVDVKVGKDSMMAASGNMSAVVFAENAVGIRLKMATARPGMSATLTIQNISAGAVRFFATMIGEAVE